MVGGGNLQTLQRHTDDSFNTQGNIWARADFNIIRTDAGLY